MPPAWEHGLRASKTFLCIMTRHYLRSPECWAQVALAKRLHKPCIALIEQGTHVPEGFFTGFLDLEIHYFAGKTDLERIANALRDKLGAVNFVDGGV